MRKVETLMRERSLALLLPGSASRGCFPVCSIAWWGWRAKVIVVVIVICFTRRRRRADIVI